MENAIGILKRSKINFNDSQSMGSKCFWARKQFETYDRANSRAIGAVVVTPNGTTAVVGSDYIPRKYENDCPSDTGPNGYESFKGHVFSLSTANTGACPNDFQAAFNTYTQGWKNLMDIAEKTPSASLANFHGIMNANAPKNKIEQEIVTSKNLIETAHPLLWRIYQRETGWCHDPASNRDIIYWRGCPKY